MVYQFDLKIYPRMIWVALESSKEEIQTKFGLDMPQEYFEGGATTTSLVTHNDSGNNGILIFSGESKLSKNHTAHESFHAALEVAKSIGMGFSFEDQEPMAYLIGFIAECIEHAEFSLEQSKKV